jgi:hypothetical protein
VIRRERGPSSSRHQTGSEPRDWISSIRPSLRSLATTLPAAPPVSFDGRSRARSSRCDAADSSTTWVSVSFTGSSIRLVTATAAVITEAPQRRETGGGAPEAVNAQRNGHSAAPFAPECQSFLDNLVAISGPTSRQTGPFAQVSVEGILTSCRMHSRPRRVPLQKIPELATGCEERAAGATHYGTIFRVLGIDDGRRLAIGAGRFFRHSISPSSRTAITANGDDGSARG